MTTVASELANKWWPLPPEKFFKPQIDDMWFAGELPPTVQDEMRSSVVTQSKFMMQVTVLQTLSAAAQRHTREAEVQRRKIAVSRVGKRVRN